VPRNLSDSFLQALIQELGKFVSGTSTRDQFRNACRNYLTVNPYGRADAVKWFNDAMQSGRVSTAIWDMVADLFAPPPAAPAVKPPAPRPAVRPAPPVLQPEPARAAPAAGAKTDPNFDVDVGEGAEPLTLKVGDVLLNNRYVLLEELGHGGMGQVFKARDRNLARAGNPNPFIALKALNATFAKDANARSALQSEAISVMRLSHDNIIRVNNFDWDGPNLFIAMEYLKGSSLDELIRTEYASGQTMVRAWHIVRSIGAALEYAHGKGVIHSDVKPGNVFITRKNVVKVLDFGISRPLAQSTAIQDTIFDPVKPIAGLSPAYASLEQWTGDEADARDDIYSFGVVIYELLTGVHPFGNASAKKAYEARLSPKRVESLTRRQWDALRHALALERDKRIRSVKELIFELEPQTFFRKNRSLIIGGVVITLAAAIAVGQHVYSDYVRRETLRSRMHHTQHAAVKLTAQQQEDVRNLLFLAQSDMALVKSSSSEEDMAYILSEGANNVNDILDSVLQIDPDNDQALGMKASAADLYLRRAQTLYERRDDKAALPLARYGIKVMPDNLDLDTLQQNICERSPPLCMAN
jgi:serine/threonine protein kinase